MIQEELKYTNTMQNLRRPPIIKIRYHVISVCQISHIKFKRINKGEQHIKTELTLRTIQVVIMVSLDCSNYKNVCQFFIHASLDI